MMGKSPNMLNQMKKGAVNMYGAEPLLQAIPVQFT